MTEIDRIGALTTMFLFIAAVLVALVGLSEGYVEALALIPVAWIFAALDPDVGRWGHVWEKSNGDSTK